MQQRVAIARALAYEPRVLLMDEPFAAVDAQTRADLEDLVRAVWQRARRDLLFVTHDIDEAVYLGQRVIVLSAVADASCSRTSTIDLPAERDQLHTRADPRFPSCAPTSTNRSRPPNSARSGVTSPLPRVGTCLF